TSRWHGVGTSCALQQRPVGTSLESLWDVLPEVHRTSAHWGWEIGSTSSTISSLLQDLSLTEASHSTAPPCKRQCRSLSCSDELGSCRSTWRPQGSRVWTSIEKRRCHSGGSVQRLGNSQLGFPAMQRSSSFSLPARSNPMEPPCFSQLPSRPSAFSGLTPFSEPSAQPLYLSHEQICLPEARESSPASSPDSTPELERRDWISLCRKSFSFRYAQLSRGMPAAALAHVYSPEEKLRNFHSLSCPGITSDDPLKSAPVAQSLRSDTGDLSENEDGLEFNGNESSDAEWNSGGHGDGTKAGTAGGKDGETLWVGLCSMTRDMYQLGGELDIEQIERN
ncbi:hypothetical protein XENOCAPTIV_021809, partial [Xenoophorus captivus]